LLEAVTLPSPPGTRGPPGPSCDGHQLSRVVALDSWQGLGGPLQSRLVACTYGMQIDSWSTKPCAFGRLEVADLMLRNTYFFMFHKRSWKGKLTCVCKSPWACTALTAILCSPHKLDFALC